MGLFSRLTDRRPRCSFAVNISPVLTVDMIVTPRIYGVANDQGISLDIASATDTGKILAMYGDLMYCAALNCWELKGNEPAEKPFTRADFHLYMIERPRDFRKTADKLLLAVASMCESMQLMASNVSGKKK